NGNHISLLPLINNSSDIVVTHLLLASLQIWPEEPNNNPAPAGLTVWTGGWNTPIGAKNLTQFWNDKSAIQAKGIEVIGSLLGSYTGLQTANDSSWDYMYGALRDGLRKYKFDGIDLDIEDANPTRNPDSITLDTTIKLIDALRQDFGPDFLITLAPVASCLSPSCSSASCISGFDYKELEKRRGKDIAFYNAQFYNGFGDAESPKCYEGIVKNGFAAEKVIMGVPSSPYSTSCNGWIPWGKLEKTVRALKREFGGKFGGVFGWEYFDSEPGGQTAPWEWA
ncbi:glycoside hydrolase family 18 protein, partial [Aulographum hederae CBS 113979]